MPIGKVIFFSEERCFGFIKPNVPGADVFFHISALQDGDEIAKDTAVSYEVGTDAKSGKIKAVSVDLVA